MNNIYKLLRQKYSTHRHVVNYVLIGITGIFVDFGIFAILFNLFNINPIVANALSGCCSITSNFTLNALFNFKTRNRLLARFLSFFGIALGGIAITSITLNIFHEGLGVNANIVKFVSLIVIVVVQYNLNKVISFNIRQQIT